MSMNYDLKKIWYVFYRLIDYMVGFMMKSEGDFLLACKNYLDFQNDFLTQEFGFLGR